MIRQKNVIVSYSKTILIYINIVLLFSCQERLDFASDFSNYKLKIVPITSVASDWAVKSNINFVDGNQSILAEYSYTNNEIRFVDLQRDSLIKTIDIPFPIRKMGSISLYDTSSFAFITDTTFYVYNQNKFIKFDYSIFHDDFIPLNYVNIIYKPSLNIIIAAVLSYNNEYENEKPYSSNFLNIYNLNDTTSSIIPFSYPEQFHDNMLGIPRLLLSSYNKDLLISFEFDDNIYKINLSNKNVETIACKTKNSTILEASFPKNGSKQEKVDAIQKNANNVGGYGIAYYNHLTNQIYRIYRPGLPIHDKEGNYYNSTDKGCNVIRLNLNNNYIDEYKLPNGQYFVQSDWAFNRFNNTLVYPKLLQSAKNENICYYNIHSMFFYNN